MFQLKKNNPTNWSALAAVFCISVVVFGFVHLNLKTADPDVFYHAKMAMLLRDQGVFTAFPWLSATTLNTSFADHHFLYHLALIPFVSTPLPLVGVKIATVLFASLGVAVFGWLLSRVGVRGAHWYALLLLTVGPFVFRLGLMKAQAFSMIMLWIALWLAYEKKYLALLVFTALYIWTYGGWPLLPALVGVWLAVSGAWIARHHGLLPLRFARRRWLMASGKICTVLAVGVIVGLVFSPYFPHNLSFYWQQIVSIAIVNYQHVIGVGAEWYPYSLKGLFVDAPALFVFWAVGIIGLCVGFKKQSAMTWTWFAYALLFLVLTAKSRRNIEYLAPMIVGFMALAITAALPVFERWLHKQKLATFGRWLPTLLVIGLLPFGIQEVRNVHRQYNGGISLGALRGPAQWLAAHAPADAIVMHSDWDDFPPLWYYNDHQRYIVGLDPTFLYLFSPQLSAEYVAITTGQQTEHIASTIQLAFGATYVVIGDTDHVAFDAVLATDPLAEEVYRDDTTKVYRLAPAL